MNCEMDIKEVEKKVNKYFYDFWYNRVHSFQNTCIKCENDRIERLCKFNAKLQAKLDKYDYDYTSSSEEEYEYDYNEFNNYNYNSEYSDENE